MLRHRAVQARKNGVNFVDKQLAETDRSGRLGTFLAPAANWATDEHKRTDPSEHRAPRRHPPRGTPAALRRRDVRDPLARREGAVLNEAAPAFGKRKAVLYATCFVNFNNTDIGAAARAVLAKNGVETEVVHPACCGMPKLELGDIESVANAARKFRPPCCRGSTRAMTSSR
jgi:glycerol-3-phosphate dehydrogenase subunit C